MARAVLARIARTNEPRCLGAEHPGVPPRPDALKQLALNADVDLHSPVPHDSAHTYLRELLLVADHGAYHIGQLVLVRRLLGAWPAEQ
jgi:hypothetical protein